MRDVLGPNTILGYCTNVHAGRDLREMRANLERHALAVKQRVSPNEPMGVGLWFSARAARELIEQDRVFELRDWLGEHGLLAYTLNGFPHGDFHEPVVKHRVYEPDWTTQARLDYTLDLARILADLLPPDAEEGSISTLPLGWPSLFCGTPGAWEPQARAAANKLHDLVHALARLELDTGKLIHVDLEPEPGCVLDTAPGVVDFFQRYLLGTRDDVSVRAYLRVCHDVCHSAVMGEAQRDAVAAYRRAGIGIGKVQLSSALRLDVAAPASLDPLSRFAEPRYLHQSVVRDGSSTRFFEDLPEALREAPPGEWTVHFHVPLHLPSIGSLGTTQACVAELLTALRPDDEVRHFEVETYAWSVLPEDLRPAGLSEGIADELAWVRRTTESSRAAARRG